MEKKKSYISGIVGALLGGLIASIPWILMYVYGGMILSLLAIIIGFGALKGYQLFRGKVDSKLPIIVMIVSLICVTVSTLIIIPLLLLNKEGISMSFENLKYLYEYDKFFDAVMKDYMISILFTFLGVGGVVSNIKKQIYEGKTDNIKISTNNLNNNEDIQKIKDVFIKLNALDKNSAVSKESLFMELNDSNMKMLFDRLKLQQIIVKYKGNYYFSIKNEKSFFRRFIKLYLKIMLVIILVTILFCLIIFLLHK